jgi:hypothetical protein
MDCAVDDALEALSKRYLISQETRQQLRDALDISRRPDWVRDRELRQLAGLPLVPSMGWPGLGSEDARWLASLRFRRIVADLRRPETLRLTPENPYEKQTPTERRATRRLADKIVNGLPEPFRPRGNKPYPYRSLVVQYIKAIERATGRPFGFSRKHGGTPRGPQFKLLQAALARALFMTGAPGAEYVAQLVCRRRKGIKIRRTLGDS